MKEIISQHHLQPLIILTDLIGGTPNNVSIKQLNNNRIQIIAGINLPLLLELLMAQSAGKSIEEIDFKELLNNSQKVWFILIRFKRCQLRWQFLFYKF